MAQAAPARRTPDTEPSSDFHLDSGGPTPPRPAEHVRIRLLRNYVPKGEVEIVGHHQEEIKRKDNVGRDHIIQEGKFVPGDARPPRVAGTGFDNKIWADTVIRAPKEEARHILDNKIGELELDD